MHSNTKYWCVIGAIGAIGLMGAVRINKAYQAPLYTEKFCQCVIGAIGAIREKLNFQILTAPIAPITH